MFNQILVLLTGGTIDGIINPGDEILSDGTSAAQKYLDSLDLNFNYCFQRVFNKDSRQINEADRKELKKTIQYTKAKKILITHGTFTMAKTGQMLKKYHHLFSDKTILLTGSMIPLQKWYPGDAPFNLGFALAGLITTKPGVYIAMNGQFFDPDQVIKNIEKSKFETALVSK